MTEDQHATGGTAHSADPPVRAPGDGSQDREQLFEAVEVIEAQPLDQRAAGYDQLTEELLAELQRSDHEAPE